MIFRPYGADGKKGTGRVAKGDDWETLLQRLRRHTEAIEERLELVIDPLDQARLLMWLATLGSQARQTRGVEQGERGVDRDQHY
jgi:hypothetical protein